MLEILVDIIELAGIIGHQTSELDAVAGAVYGTRIPLVRNDLSGFLQGLGPNRLTNFWQVFDAAYQEVWYGKQVRQ